MRELEEFQLKIDELEYQAKFVMNALSHETKALNELLPAGQKAEPYLAELNKFLVKKAPQGQPA